MLGTLGVWSAEIFECRALLLHDQLRTGTRRSSKQYEFVDSTFTGCSEHCGPPAFGVSQKADLVVVNIIAVVQKSHDGTGILGVGLEIGGLLATATLANPPAIVACDEEALIGERER